MLCGRGGMADTLS
ncbi:hypothetical protein SAMN04488603_101952 [Paenibacillus sp. cl130]|nr:hypothetical protein SAMN04488603_101952 [Paenibacillus sp. cl130]